MSYAQQIAQELKKVESKIHEWEDKLEEFHDDRNNLERELRRNDRGIVNIKDELHGLHLLKESLVAKRAAQKKTVQELRREIWMRWVGMNL